MWHNWLRFVALVAVVACTWAGLAARQDRGEPADDLAWVPDKTKFALNVQFGRLWNSELGKVFRKAMGDQVARMEREFREERGVSPGEMERLTVFFGPEADVLPSFVFLSRATKKLDPRKVLPAVVQHGKEERFGGQEVYAGPAQAAFIGPDGRTVVSSHRNTLEALLKRKPRKPVGELAAMLRLSSKHDITLYAEPPPPDDAKGEVLPKLKLNRADLTPKTVVAWLDFGYTMKAGMRARFADEKAAVKGQKALEGARTLAGLSLPASREELARTSKRAAALLKKVEEALAEATIERKGMDVRVELKVTLEKKEVDEGLKELAVIANRTQSQNNLKQIGIAFHNYHDSQDRLPPAAICDKGGKPLLSWRVAILPYIDEDKLYKEFKLDEPWDSPHNKKLIARMPKVYDAPAGKAAPGGTFYQAFQGKGTIFDGKASLRLADITDGTSNTILAVEAGKDVPWTKPEDVPFDPAGKLPKLGAVFGDGFNALMADGSVRFLPATTKEATLKAMITRNGGEKVPDER